MKITLLGLIRCSLFLGLGLFLAALGFGRLDATLPGLGAGSDRRAANPVLFIHNAYRLDGDPRSRFLDAATGAELDVELPPGERLDHISCTPWSDAWGRRRMAGRWSRFSGKGVDLTGEDFGLGLYQFPDGQCIEQVRCEVLPVAPPCWYPDSDSRILFASGDGHLYHFDFASVHDRSGLKSRQPLAITWDEQAPKPGDVRISDPTWPSTLPELRDRLLVTLHHRDPTTVHVPFSPGAIWWLQLDPTGTRIVDAGPLYDQGEPSPADEVCQRPAVGRGPDGQLTLLYQCRRLGELQWRLRTALIHNDPKTSALIAGPSMEIDVSDSPSVAGFSPDGLWAFAVPRCPSQPPVIRRLSLLPAIALRAGAEILSALPGG